MLKENYGHAGRIADLALHPLFVRRVTAAIKSAANVGAEVGHCRHRPVGRDAWPPAASRT